MGDRSAQDLTGQRLGHFRVDGVIGRGGMSVLYRATDTRLGRRVALKVIDEALAADREFRERFVDEARNTSAVDHAHVVPLYDFDETDGHLYIAMRHVEGPDLASVIDGRPLTVARTLRLLGQVADALDAVHARGLVHLDVKPANVLVTTRESAGEHVYLADFGLTRRGATGHRTSGGDFLGSPTYAAPEHLRGEPVDARTDVYSLTCVLFTCLTGRAPYLGSVTEVIDGHLAGDVPSAADLAGLDPRIDDVVHRGMDPDRPRRHESASAVVEAARGALTGPALAPLVGPGPATGVPSGPFAAPGSGATGRTGRPGRPVGRAPGAPRRPVPPVPPAGPVPPAPPAPRVGPVAPVAPVSGSSPPSPVPPVGAVTPAGGVPVEPRGPSPQHADPPSAAAPGAEERAGETSGSTSNGTSAPPAAVRGPGTPPTTPPRGVDGAGVSADPAAPRRPGAPGPPPGPPPSGPFPAPTVRPSGPFPTPSGPFPAPGPPTGPQAGPPPGPLTRSSVAPPMRLRDPMPPDRDGSFERNAGGVSARVILIIAGVAAVVLIVLLVLLLG
ncbi:serine/threonine-protein kinase [Actinomycetospora sp. C-140]